MKQSIVCFKKIKITHEPFHAFVKAAGTTVVEPTIVGENYKFIYDDGRRR